MSITFIGAAIWMLVAMIIAVRQALDYQSTWRAIGVVVIGFLVQATFPIKWIVFDKTNFFAWSNIKQWKNIFCF